MKAQERDHVLQAMAGCFPSMMGDISDGMLLVDPTTFQILGVNSAFEKMTGMADVNTLTELREALPDVLDYDMLLGCAQMREAGPGPVFEARVEHVDGALRDIEVRPTLLASQGVTMLQLMFRDTSGMKRMEKHFRHSHDMNTVGQVADGMGQDFEDIFGVMELATDLLLAEDESLGDLSRQAVRMMTDSTRRAEELCGRLRTVGSRCNSRSSVMDLHEMIDDALFMLPYTLKSRVRVSLDLRADSYLVFGDALKIQSALMNLCINADQAMPDAGTLRIETRNLHLEHSKTTAEGFHLAAGTYLRINVVDTGCGMEPEQKEKAFDPYYSTKTQSDKRTSGLGLTMVHRIMMRHHGAVALASEPGEGTTASLILPLEVNAMGGQQAVCEVGEGEDTILLFI